ncbi:GntR family transcriptional regulator [Streptomyces sp. SL13]|uniref:GntR family transcriptional regulator n=1 Tax=Streptantibioticus silvisoli TaxID=2705255 RepID=A0AA90HG53_9ACTN|nr:GntR family transcriptional regulator [Streptantibioticus silvisoli]MDI5965942.1 GntR family transcriptional regulator [Streptantibioticus silvisoli]MDI5974317.1 GntR family transcriptional regulator [Streptantibioticus silvisoli]
MATGEKGSESTPKDSSRHPSASARTVCEAIRDDIVSGHYVPGGRLTEDLLAKRYGVSRVPVREALRTLESEGFVRTRRHAGASVAEPSEQEALDLLEIRGLLEPLAVARAAARRTEQQLRVLRGLVRLGQVRAREGELADLPALDGWFHETLTQAAASPGLTSLLTQLRRKISWMYAVELPGRAEAAWAEHGAITDAVARHDVERARALTAAHVARWSGAHRLRTSKHPVNKKRDGI